MLHLWIYGKYLRNKIHCKYKTTWDALRVCRVGGKLGNGKKCFIEMLMRVLKRRNWGKCQNIQGCETRIYSVTLAVHCVNELMHNKL